MILSQGVKLMKTLPHADSVIIPKSKLVDYALNPEKDMDKARAFERALGYNQKNVDKLIEKIHANVKNFPAKSKGDKGYGELFEVIMDIEGENGKIAKVLTAWIDDRKTGEFRLVTLHIN
jgi:hypothetical protein